MRVALAARRDGRLMRAVPALTGLGLGLLAIGPGIGRGYLLSYDMVFVPRQPFSAAMPGRTGTPPRAVPSDLFVALWSRLLPADIVQKLLLLSIFVLAAAGAAALLNDKHWLARLGAGVFYAWNPFVAERLILGQWALLLGYCGLPWVLRAAADSDRPLGLWTLRLAVAPVPAAIGGFAAMCLSCVVSIPAAVAGARGWPRRAARVGSALAVTATVSLPWLIPALSSTIRTGPVGVNVFAARADTPFGTVGSLLALGGTWNRETVPAGYGGPGSVLWLAGVVLALGGFLLLGRSRWPGLGFSAAVGLAIASLGAFAAGRGILRWLITVWPGFAVLRDGQQFVAPLALAEAAGAGLALAWMLGLRKPAAMKDAGRLVAVIAIIAPVVLLPGLAWGAAGRLKPVQYPADWLAARQLIDGTTTDGKALLLPWGAYRRYGWNGGEAVLDPWPRMLRLPVIWNDAVQVGRITVPAEDPVAASLTDAITSSRPLTRALRSAGVRFVIVDAGSGLSEPTPGYPFQSRLPGCHIVLAGPGLIVYKVGEATG